MDKIVLIKFHHDHDFRTIQYTWHQILNICILPGYLSAIFNKLNKNFDLNFKTRGGTTQ